MVPAPLCLAIAVTTAVGRRHTGMEHSTTVPLPDSVRVRAQQHAAALEGESRALAVRTGSPAEGRSVASTIACALNRRPVFIETDKVAGFGPWLLLRRLLPVFCQELAPAERRRLPSLPGYNGPILAVCGPEGTIEMPQGSAASWSLPIPSQEGRRTLWLAALGRQEGSNSEEDRDAIELAEQLAGEHRHGTGRIAHLGRLAPSRRAGGPQHRGPQRCARRGMDR
jgi:hypothetical protein